MSLKAILLSAHKTVMRLCPTYFCDGSTFDIRIQLAQQLHRLFSAKLSQRVIVQEKVDTEIRLCDNGRVEDAELADARQDEVLESLHTSHTRSVVDE